MSTIKEERVSTTSSGLLSSLFGKSPADLGQLARDITEKQSPTSQGKSTEKLAKFIVDRGNTNDNPYYKQASFYQSQYNSNTCYLCGYPIEAGMVEELEHVLPIGEALALTGIVQQSRKDFIASMPEIYNKPEALSYLLEYARSHRCCNQIKGVTSFLNFNGNPPFNEPYKIDGNAVSNFLKNIWVEASPDGSRWQEPGACANSKFESYFSKVSKETFIANRRQFIVDNYLNPILKYIYQVIQGAPTFKFAQLIFLSNQALSIDQTIWESLGIEWKGDVVTRETVLKTLYDKSLTFDYKTTRDTVLNQILNVKDTHPILNAKMMEYYNTKKEGRTSRNIDASSFKRFINVDFVEMKKLHIDYLKNKKVLEGNVIETGIKNEGFLGFEYMFYLLAAQNEELKLFDSMIGEFNKMMLNINNYTDLYIYLYILFFDPFKIPSKPSYPNEAGLAELNDFTSMYIQALNYGPIHDNFVLTVFGKFNYVCLTNSEKETYLNIQQLNDYTNYVVMSPLLLETATSIIDIANQYNAAAALLSFGPKYDDYMQELQASDALVKIRLLESQKKRKEDLQKVRLTSKQLSVDQNKQIGTTKIRSFKGQNYVVPSTPTRTMGGKNKTLKQKYNTKKSKKTQKRKIIKRKITKRKTIKRKY